MAGAPPDRGVRGAVPTALVDCTKFFNTVKVLFPLVGE